MVAFCFAACSGSSTFHGTENDASVQSHEDASVGGDGDNGAAPPPGIAWEPPPPGLQGENPAQCDPRCVETHFCRLVRGEACNAPGTCLQKPPLAECDSLPALPVCGCDGHDYRTSCEARSYGTNVNYPGPCREISCAAQRISAEGTGGECADRSLGFAWNGSGCFEIKGCNCNRHQDSDCDQMFYTMAECERVYAPCRS